MKSMIMAVVGAVVLSGAVAMAQDATSRPTSRPGHGDRGAMLENALKELNLTPEVAQKVRDIFKTQDEAMQAFRQANGEKVRDIETQLRAARQANDETKVADLQKQLETLRAPVKEALETAQKALEGVLSKEQLEKLRQLMPPPGGGPRERIQRLEEHLGLTDAQKAQAKAIIDEAAAAADKATDPKDKRAAWEAALQKFTKDVLTDDQRAKLKDMGPGHDGAGATSGPRRHNDGNPPPPPPGDGATPPPPPSAGGANPPTPPPAG
jgi:Spy/CpxP family protein refolding chaperone